MSISKIVLTITVVLTLGLGLTILTFFLTAEKEEYTGSTDLDVCNVLSLAQNKKELTAGFPLRSQFAVSHEYCSSAEVSLRNYLASSIFLSNLALWLLLVSAGFLLKDKVGNK